MRKILLALGIVAGIWLLSMTTADACGDKSLRIGHGVRFQHPAAHPAKVLIYLPSNAPADTTARAPQLQRIFKQVSHKAHIIRGADMLSEALHSGQYDILLLDLAETASLQQFDDLTTKPIVVPVASKGTKAEIATVQKQYRYIVKHPRDAEEYLDTIDDAMRSKVRGA
jgi:hypothetical protein